MWIQAGFGSFPGVAIHSWSVWSTSSPAWIGRWGPPPTSITGHGNSKRHLQGSPVLQTHSSSVRCLKWDTHPLLPSDISTPGSWAFRIRSGLTPSAPNSQDSGLTLNNTSSFLVLQPAADRLWDFSSSITTRTNSYNKSPLTHIYMLYPIISVSLENHDEYTIGS